MSSAPESATGLALLVDFGGVLTASVVDSFASFSVEISGDPDLVWRVLVEDAGAHEALVAHEEGRLSHEGFESALAEGLGRHGVAVRPEGLVAGMQRGLRPDRDMIALVARMRAAGHRVVLASNSLGKDCYRGFDLAAMFDDLVVSGEVGVRKPRAEFFAIACERAGVRPGSAVLIDDLDQNVRAAREFGMHAVLHRSAADTDRALNRWVSVSGAGELGRGDGTAMSAGAQP